MNAVVLVLGILVLTGAVLAAVLVPLTRRWRRGRDEFWAAFDAEVAGSGEAVRTEREPASYRGGTGPWPQVKGNGWVVLTDRRLLFRKTTGPVIEVPLADVAGARLEAVFLGSRVAGRRHLVLTCADGSEVGFYVGDPDAWLARLAPPAA